MYSTKRIKQNAQGKLAAVWFYMEENIKSSSKPVFVPLEFLLHSLRSPIGDRIFLFQIFVFIYVENSLRKAYKEKDETADILKLDCSL